MPVNNMSEDGHWDFREHNLFKFGKILSTNEMREMEEFVDSMKWGQPGAVYVGEGMTIDSLNSPTEVVYSDNLKYLTLKSRPDDEFEMQPLDSISAGLDDLQDPEPLEFDPPEFDYVEGKKPRRDRRSYVLYETAESIAEKWDDDSLIGYCEYCGMADAPIVIARKNNSDITAKCKWCAELSNLTWHIKYNGGVGYAQDTSTFWRELIEKLWKERLLMLGILLIWSAVAIGVGIL